MKGHSSRTGSALNYALRLLGIRDRSERELTERLMKKGFQSNDVEKVIESLKQHQFINDQRLAMNLRKAALESKFLGRKGTKAYLIKRGIAEQVAEEILGNDEEYIIAARRIIEKKKRTMINIDDAIVRRRLWGVLMRRGFSYDIIRKTLKKEGIDEEL